jgi:hypothetical protein
LPEPRSAWREPMLYLVVALPATVVVAGFVTLGLAMRDGGADSVPSQVRRTAQVQVEDGSIDRRAATLGLEAVLRRDADTGALTLSLRSPLPLDDGQLQLQLLHPARAAGDRELTLVRSGEAWYGRIEPVDHACNVRLESIAGDWRLSGRLPADAHEARLRPAVSR